MGMFVSQLGMAETKKSEANFNGMRKREGKTHHPVRAVLCGCSPNCGAFHINDTNVDMRTIQLEKRKKAKLDRECHHFS